MTDESRVDEILPLIISDFIFNLKILAAFFFKKNELHKNIRYQIKLYHNTMAIQETTEH